jgi:dipeptidyl aminopeptidase/acylaminoacyl peptidase
VADTIFIDDIPVIERCNKNGGSPMPLLILSHGFSSDKKTFAGKNNIMERFAEKGFFVVSFDNRSHGERKGRSDIERINKGASGFDVYRIRKLIKESADDVVKIIDHYEKNPSIDAENTGISGVSMGGFVSFRAALMDKRIKAVAPIIGSPYWEDIPEVNPPLLLKRSPVDLFRLKIFSKMFSPNYFVNKFEGKRILIQNGGADKHVHIKAVENFYGDLVTIVPNAELVVYPEIKHEVTEEMISKAVDFLTNEMIVNRKDWI